MKTSILHMPLQNCGDTEANQHIIQPHGSDVHTHEAYELGRG